MGYCCYSLVLGLNAYSKGVMGCLVAMRIVHERN